MHERDYGSRQWPKSKALALLVMGAATVAACASIPEAPTSASASTSSPTATSTTGVPATTTTMRAPQPEKTVNLFDTTGVISAAGDLIGNEHVIVAVTNNDLTSFTSTGRRLAATSFDEESISRFCAKAVATDDDGTSRLFTQRTDVVPARGVEPEQKVVYLSAWDVETFEQLWETELTRAPGSTNYCAEDAELTATMNGRWVAASGIGPNSAGFVIDARNGRAREVPFAPTALGNFVAHNSEETGEHGAVMVQTPDTGTTVTTAPIGHPTMTAGTALARSFTPGYDSMWLPDAKTVVVHEGGSAARAHFVDAEAGLITRSLDLPVRDQFGGWYTYGTTFMLDEEADRFYVGPTDEACAFDCRLLVAYEFSTMTEVWRLDDARRICAAGDGQVAVEINNQVAVLDASNGSQVDYAAEQSGCGYVFGPYGVDPDDERAVKLLVGSR